MPNAESMCIGWPPRADAYDALRARGDALLPRPPARGGLSGWQRARVAHFIETNLASTVRLAALAELVDLSPYHFARAFKTTFGLPPHRYHRGRRIERAMALLGQPDATVTAVALAVGFADTSAFSTAFRKATGCSPSAYRRLRMAMPTLSLRGRPQAATRHPAGRADPRGWSPGSLASARAPE